MNKYIEILYNFSRCYQENGDRKQWQGEKVNMPMVEILNFMNSHDMPQNLEDALSLYQCDRQWCLEHLKERLSGQPLNPPPSHKIWNTKTENYLSKIDKEKFSHTYPERYNYGKLVENGVRYKNGNLDDLIKLLQKDLYTRQAYFPMFCFEDINAGLQDERVPCTLGYYFYVNQDGLNCNYIIRSCDVIRHLHNDLFLTWGLCEYIAKKLDVKLGKMLFICFNLHCFKNDLYTLYKRLEKAGVE